MTEPDTDHPEAVPEPVREGTRPSPVRRPLFSAGVGGLIAAIVYFSVISDTEDPLHLYFGLLILVGSTLPVLLWARRGEFRLPVFEVFMLSGVNTYAIPLLTGHTQLAQYSNQDITVAALGVLLFQVVANLTYFASKGRPKTSRAWTEDVIATNVVDYLEYGMIITTAYTAIILLTDWIPYDLAGILRAVCYGVGIMTSFILSRMWGEGVLAPRKRTIFATLLILQVLFSWTGLFLVGGISILVLAFLGYITGSKRLPIIPMAVAAIAAATLHNGKSAMRLKYWEGRAPKPTLTEIPGFFSEWIGYSLDPEISRKTKETNALLQRTSLIHILCLVVSRTPDPLPFLEGQTYGHIPGQFVPRFFWSDKPVGHISTHTLSIYYGLQDEQSTWKTTIAFGLLSEAYANFGFLGLAMIGISFAFVFKIVGDWATYSPLLSYPGLFQIVLMAWSFQVELTLSGWITSLYQACIAVLGVPFLVRNFFGR
jgi:hypothetical protein